MAWVSAEAATRSLEPRRVLPCRHGRATAPAVALNAKRGVGTRAEFHNRNPKVPQAQSKVRPAQLCGLLQRACADVESTAVVAARHTLRVSRLRFRASSFARGCGEKNGTAI